MAFKAVLKVGGEERTLLTYHNYLFDMWHGDFEKVTKRHATLYDYVVVAKASPYAFRRYCEPMGGLFDFTMESTDSDDFFYYWFKSNDKEGRTNIKNGVIELYNSNDEYMPMRRVEFWDAWITNISESHASTGNTPMILAFTISPATIRVNKEVVFQKNWWQTDINRQDAQPQEKAEPAIKRIYWKGRQGGKERSDIMLNHNLLLEVEFSKYTQGDSVELTVKQSNARRIKAQAKEFTVNGTIDENGLMLIPNFTAECDFKEDNQNFGNIEFYYKGNKVGELKENFGWTYIKDGGLLKVFVNVETTVKNLSIGCTLEDYKTTIFNQFKRTLEMSSDGLVTGKIFFSGTHTRELPQLVPKIHFDEKRAYNNTDFYFMGNQKQGYIEVLTEKIDTDNNLLNVAITSIHELLHTIRLEHPHERTVGEDTKLIKKGDRYYTTPQTDPLIFYNIMSYDDNIVNDTVLKDLWKTKFPDYITKNQLKFMFKNIDQQKEGIGTENGKTVILPSGVEITEFDYYWVEEKIGDWVDPRLQKFN